MERVLNRIALFIFILIVFSLTGLNNYRVYGEAAPLGDKDLELQYAQRILVLFGTQYNNFTSIVGNKGVWEDENRYQYTWGEGQAAFIKTNVMKKPELVQVVLSDRFKTPRGIKKGSTVDDLFKAYPDYTDTTEAGNGLWYVYRWTSESKSLLLKGRMFSLSFFVEDGRVKSVFLKLEGEETSGIPVG